MVLLCVVFPTSDQEPIQKYAFVYCWGILWCSHHTCRNSQCGKWILGCILCQYQMRLMYYFTLQFNNCYYQTCIMNTYKILSVRPVLLGNSLFIHMIYSEKLFFTWIWNKYFEDELKCPKMHPHHIYLLIQRRTFFHLSVTLLVGILSTHSIQRGRSRWENRWNQPSTDQTGTDVGGAEWGRACIPTPDETQAR